MKLGLIAAIGAFAFACVSAGSAAVRFSPKPPRANAPATLHFQYVALPNQDYVVDDVVTATDGSLWFDAMRRYECHPSRICTKHEFGHLAGGSVTTYAFPPSVDYPAMAAGPNGTLWLLSGTTLYVYDASGTLIDTIPTSDKAVDVTTPQLGADGRMWFTEFAGLKPESRIVAVASDGTVSSYRCKNFCGTLVPGPETKLWGIGLNEDYSPFIYSVTSDGRVHEFPGTDALLIAAPKMRLFGEVALFQIDRVDPRAQLTPFADLSSLGLDQAVYYSSSRSRMWFAATKANETQAVVGSVSERGEIESEPFGSIPCSETYVYLSDLAQGADGAMYGGYGCGDSTGTHAGYLVRVGG